MLSFVGSRRRLFRWTQAQCWWGLGSLKKRLDWCWVNWAWLIAAYLGHYTNQFVHKTNELHKIYMYRLSPLNLSGSPNILLQDLLQCLSFLNELNLKLKTLFLYICWSFLRKMMSHLSSLLLPFYTTLGGLSSYCSLPSSFSGHQS